MKRLFFVLLSLALFLMLKAGKAQEVRFNVNAPPVVSVGDQFRVQFSVNAAGSDFRGPGFKGLTVVSGPNQSTSSSIQIINGAMNQTVTYSYTYVLHADKEGEYEVGSASVTVAGKSYKTQPFKIKVQKGAVARQQPNTYQQPGRGNQPQNAQSGGANISSNDLFIKTIISKPEVYQGEQILVTQKIYARVSLVGFEDVKAPVFSGFWASEVKMPEQVNLRKETVNGVVYQVAELKRTVLFPQKSGTLTIEPLKVTAVVQVRTQNRQRTGDPFFDQFFNDPFFGGGIQNVKKEVYSTPVTVKVKPLPDAGKPDDYTGAVGSFSIKSSVDKTELKANDAITYKVTISGNGNLELIDKLNVGFPSDFEVYDPKVTNSLSATAAGVSGSRTFEYLLIPRNQGTFKIEPVSLSFFNLAKKTYETVSAQGFEIRVGKGDGRNMTYSGMDKEDIKYLGSDIRFINLRDTRLASMGFRFYNTLNFWLLLLVAPVLFIIVVLIWRRRIKLLSDQSLMKNKRATKVAGRRLKKAGVHLKKGEEEVFYVEISQALWGYLADKLDIPVASLSAEKARESLESQGIGPELTDEYLSTIESCEFARFAPGVKEEKMDHLYQQAMKVITTTEKEIK